MKGRDAVAGDEPGRLASFERIQQLSGSGGMWPPIEREIDEDVGVDQQDHSRDWLGRQACLLPRLKAPVKCPHAFEAPVQKYARQTGARGLARSRAIQNDLLVERHRVDVSLKFTRWDASRPWDHLGGPAERLLASQVDHQDLRWLRGEQFL